MADPDARQLPTLTELAQLATIATPSDPRDLGAIEAVADATCRALPRFPTELRDPYGQWIMTILARAARDRGGLHASRRLLERAATDFASAGSPLELTLELVEVLRVQGELDEARRRMDQAEVALAERVASGDAAGALPLQIQNLLVHGMLDLSIGWIDHAYGRAERAKDLADRLGDPGYAAAVIRQLAELAIATDNEEYAMALLDEARTHLALTPTDSSTGVARRAIDARYLLLEGVARFDLSQRDPTQIPTAERCVEDAIDTGLLSPMDLLVAEKCRASLAISGGDYGAAMTHLSAARQRLDALAERSEADPRTFTTDAALLTALEAAASAIGPRDAERDHATLDRLRLDYDRFLVTWGDLPVVPGGIGFLHFSDRRRVLSELIGMTLRVEPADASGRDALQEVLKAHAKGSLARELGLAVGTTREVQDRLVPEDGALLVFVPGPLVTHVFVVDRERITVHAGAGKEALDERLLRFVSLVARRPQGDASAVERSRRQISRLGAEILHDLVPADVLTHLRTLRRLAVTGTDLLFHLPFESLPFDDSRTFGTTHAITNLPSLTVGLELAARARPSATRDLYFVGAPDTADPQYRLPLTDDDVEHLTLPLGHGVGASRSNDRRALSIVRRGPDACASAFAAPELGECAVLLVLAHGVFLPEEAMPQGLRLAPDPSRRTGGRPGDDGIVSSARLGDLLHASPPVVVLSACGTARAAERRGEDGFSHLGGVFLRKGADCVILARHDIDYRATLDLNVELLRGLAAGMAPADAMAGARRKVAARWPHPYFHALMQVFGRGDRAIR